jgi:hypothetical protein
MRQDTKLRLRRARVLVCTPARLKSGTLDDFARPDVRPTEPLAPDGCKGGFEEHRVAIERYVVAVIVNGVWDTGYEVAWFFGSSAGAAARAGVAFAVLTWRCCFSRLCCAAPPRAFNDACWQAT